VRDRRLSPRSGLQTAGPLGMTAAFMERSGYGFLHPCRAKLCTSLHLILLLGLLIAYFEITCNPMQSRLEPTAEVYCYCTA
jgi:hypothetical protein